jgi:diguanylate cyclase (GGDEF)-like protein
MPHRVDDSAAPRTLPGEAGGGAVTAATGPALVATTAVVCVLLWSIDPSGRAPDAWRLWAGAAGAILTAGLAHPRTGRRPGGHLVSSAAATAFATLAIVVSGEASSAVAPIFVPIAIYSAYVLSRPLAISTVALIAAAFAAALAVGDVTAPGVLWSVTVVTTASSAYVVRILRRRLHRLVARLDAAARIDHLTGLLNRRAFDERLALELRRAERGDGPLTVLVGDVDRLKAINDEEGHAAGDRALRRVAAALAAEARGSDAVARIGGDEFAAVLADTDRAGAQQYVDRVRGRLRRARPATTLPTDLSVGTATFARDGRDAAELLRAADAALYRRKRARTAA